VTHPGGRTRGANRRDAARQPFASISPGARASGPLTAFAVNDSPNLMYILALLLIACSTSNTFAPEAPAPNQGEATRPGGAEGARVEKEALIRAFLRSDGWSVHSCGCDGFDTDFEQIWCLAGRGDQAGRFAILRAGQNVGKEWAYRDVGAAKYTVQLQDMAASDELLEGLARSGATSGEAINATLPGLGWTVVPDPLGLSKYGDANRGDLQAVVRSWDAPPSVPQGSRRRDHEGTSRGVVGTVELLVTVNDIAAARAVLDRWVPKTSP
jgi:hypothetical protein